MVVTGITDEQGLRAAGERMLTAGATGLLVAEQVRGGIELLVGVTAEAVRDVSSSVLPLTRARAERMLTRLRIARLCMAGGVRPPPTGRPSSTSCCASPKSRAPANFVELDIPLLARPEGVIGLDALVSLAVPGDTKFEMASNGGRV
jgi:hypothetical protein